MIGFLRSLIFAEPKAFLLLLALPPILFRIWRGRRRSTPKLRFSSIDLLDLPRRTLRTRLRGLLTLFPLMAFILLVVALARPQSPWKENPRRSEGISIMLVMDVSESMRALDFQPNRLEKVKEVAKQFISQRNDDLIGIVIFAKETFTLCPLTQDYAALTTFLDRINFDLVDGNATAIGMGLSNAVNKIKDSPTKSKVVILLTDGENNWGEIQPLPAAEIAKQLGVRVYTIGVGSRGLVEIPVAVPGGTIIQTIRSHIDTETMGGIAEKTGGQFFEATDGKKLEAIYAQIDKMEKTKFEETQTNYFDELAHYLIIPALLLFGIAFLLDQTWLWSFP